MNLEALREYCMAKNGVTEEFPFGDQTLVFKVMGKVFLLTGMNEDELSFNVKCDPENAIEYREKYDFVLPGYHMNKKHWNTVNYNGNNSKLLWQFVDDSYNLVAGQLPKALKLQLDNQ